VGLVIIACATVEQTNEFLEGLEVPLPGELYIDLSRKSHKAFKLFRGVWQSLVPPIWDGLQKYGWRGIIEGSRLGFETAHLAGDSWQQGGTFLMGPGRVCHFAHRETHPGDWADMNFIIRKFLRPDGDAEMLDYPKAIATYLDSRDSKRAKVSRRYAGKGRLSVLLLMAIAIACIVTVYWDLVM